MLILTEKSSVANDFSSALNCPKQKGYYSNGSTEIAYCVGHLFRLQDPDFYDERFKSWKEIPCIPQKFSYAFNENTYSQSKLVLELLKKHRTDNILIATDADREGEIIARECLELSGITDFSRIKRFWVSQALTKEVVLEGIKNAKPMIEYNTLGENGFARQHSDWLCGINFTRYVSVAANKKLSIGRVKTALLSAIETRCSQIESFKSEKYYEFYAYFGAKRFAHECRGIHITEDDKTHFKDDSLFKSLESDTEKNVIVKDNKTERKETPAPQLYNLNAVQKDAFKVYGLSADETLNIIQKLYEEYKCVSYPRTPSKVMGSGNVELVKSIFLNFAKTNSAFQDALKISDISLNNKRCFNDAKLEAHHALIPLKELPVNANEKEKQVYNLILNRFLTAFASPYIYNKQTVLLSVNNHIYKVSGNQTIDYGWKRFVSSETFRSADNENSEEETENNQSLESIDWNNLLCTDITIKEKRTKPPKYFNEASIISFMENPKSEDEEKGKLVGLGTQATRHTFIPELIKNEYIKIEKKNITITQLGRTVINAVRNSSIKTLADISETTKWEQELYDNPELFETNIRSFVSSAVKFQFNIEKLQEENQIICPLCKKPLRFGTTKNGYNNWYCSGYKEGCQYKIWENLNGTKLSEKDIINLCNGKQTSTKTFISQKTGKEYKAKLFLASNGEINFEFAK